MKTLYKALIILILIAVAAFYFAPSQTLSLTGTPVSIAFGDTPIKNPYDTVGKYYIAEFNPSGDSSNLIFVPEGLEYETDRLELKLVGYTATWKAPLVTPPTPMKYRQVNWIYGLPGFETLDVKYREVSMHNPFIQTFSYVYLSTPGDSVKSSSVMHSGEVNNVGSTVETITVKHEGVDRTIYIVFDNLVFKSGDLPPAGDYVVFEDFNGNELLTTHDNLADATSPIGTCYADDVSTWNCYAENTFAKALLLTGDYSGIDGYDDYSNWLYTNNKLRDVCREITDDCDYQNNEVSIYYPTSVFTQHVSVYVPEELAEFIMLVKPMPHFVFDPIPEITGREGDYVLVNVKGRAEGSGTINLRMQGTGIESVDWQQSTQQTMVAGKDYTFPAYVKISQVGVNTKLSATVYAQPVDVGIPTETTFVINAIDVSPEDPKYDLTVKCIDTNDKVVESAEIYVNNVFSGYGSITKSVPGGSHTVYSKNVTGWYAGYLETSPKTVTVGYDITVEIPFTEEPPEEEPDEFMGLLMIGGIAIIAIVLLSMIGKEIGYDITPTHTLILIVLVVVAVGGYIVGTVALDVIDRFLTALENFELLG